MLAERIKAPIHMLLDIIYPPRCVACRQEVSAAHSLCTSCFSSIRMISDPSCACCGEPFDFAVEKGALCGRCLSDEMPYDRACSVMIYDDASRRMITRFKYSDRTHLAVILSQLMSVRGHELLSTCDVIAPVPLHWRRHLARRYNQSYLLARLLAQKSGKPVMKGLMRRVRHTSQQTGLSRSERERNVRGAFKVSPRAAVKDKSILLVDDVLTTGATIESCARALKKAGAGKVLVLTAARRVARG
ncbi:MAG: ComF family protein [Rickettsiales bacterium]